jgi:hypothetical protein
VIHTGLDAHKKPTIELSDTENGEKLLHCVVEKTADLKKIKIGDAILVHGNAMRMTMGFIIIKHTEVITK